ncbi:FAD:protein FMN transferase [Maribellus comscasis]|uniref:FAD:protein FMN transferase n=1 Tax=Maribellus comscasis TaxID=2681766 RepID=A0A6I6JQN8_9BACT|nr:FAD:protein FMN transferase [Maribellus comscasis]QGY45296.1 FAD:protein FMN transferase [Maribellus comscasis]
MSTRIFFITGLLILALGACQHSPSKYVYNEGFVYGTIYHFVYESPQGKDLQEEIQKKLSEYNSMFSTYDNASVISKINNNENVKLTPEFVNCFEKAIEISKITGGAFDITAGPLINAWGFGPDDKEKMTQEKVDSLLTFTGYQKIKLENKKVIKENPQMKIDMSAIAKGYTCDLIGNFLAAKGCKNYMIDIGGEIVTKGINEKGKTWGIGISRPEEDAFFAANDYDAVVELPENAMATSGNYRNFYIEDGKKYAHTIDPKTGYPVQHSILSSTVLADNCMTADAYATAFMVLGLEKGIEIAGKVPEISVYFIYADENGENQIYMSDGFEQFLRK